MAPDRAREFSVGGQELRSESLSERHVCSICRREVFAEFEHPAHQAKVPMASEWKIGVVDQELHRVVR